ncbi:hypothetical protein D1007_22126 [Hordeum vulgare]|nr:hypothetical protein D1007_22126 [Hordeum vulgare]
MGRPKLVCCIFLQCPKRNIGGKIPKVEQRNEFVALKFAAHQTAASDEGYYGFVATMDVYNFNLGTEQYTVGSMDLFDVGDGEPVSYSAIQIGWEVSPKMYGDSRTRLAALWTVGTICCIMSII